MLHVVAFITIYVLLTSCEAINYCRSKMCAYTNLHTFCQFPAGPSANCTGYIYATLTALEKKLILARLNRRRDEVAAGRLRGLFGAANMLKLHWVEELAKEAQIWADQCRPPKTPEEQDVCRDLYSVTVGQCVATVVGEAPGLKVESMVDMWYMQGLHYRANITLYEPPVSSKRYYGDFAQMMWARSFMVGCGRSRFMMEIRGRLRSVERLVCNFSPRGPAPHRAVWSPGATATACPPRAVRDVDFTSLCDYKFQENESKYITSNDTTVEEHTLLNTVLDMERNDLQSNKSLDEKYLTNLAIATLSDTVVSTVRYVSMQKRDVVENIVIDNSDSNEVDRLSESTVLNPTMFTNQIIITKTPKKKLKLVGRPKSYNVEELSGIGGDHRKENLDTVEDNQRQKALMNTMIDDDDEYNAIDNVEDAVTTNERNLIPKAVNENIPSRRFNVEHYEDTSAMIPTQLGAIANEEIVPDRNRVNLNMTFSEQRDSATIRQKLVEDDYFTDPETVNELQAALDRMEQAGEAKAFENSPGKVRRDLRDAPVDTNELPRESDNSQLADVREPPSSRNHEEDIFNTTDRTPMMNMMMKYMPYLKKYENNLMTSNSRSIYLSAKLRNVVSSECLLLLSLYCIS